MDKLQVDNQKEQRQNQTILYEKEINTLPAK